MNEHKTDLQVSSAEAAADAMAYALTAMLPAFTVTYAPSTLFPARPGHRRKAAEHPLLGGTLRLDEMMSAVYQKNTGSFPSSQRYHYGGRYQMYPHKARLDASVRYLSSAKEANDLTCLAAEIGAALKQKLGARPSVEKIIRVYQKWINSTFRYVSTGQIEDHSAAALIRNRCGVCQAIAALTVLVLPHLGLVTRYVSGQGMGTDGFGPHAWNLIRAALPFQSAGVEEQLRWYHVDFTFGMNGFTPHTLTPFSTRAFEKTHRWDASEDDHQTICRQLRETERLRSAQIRMQANHPTWQLGEITVTSSRPLLVGGSGRCHWIDLSTVLRFLGGGCEYLPGEDCLRICLDHRQYLVENGSSYLDGPEGYLDVSILLHLPLQMTGAEDSLALKVVPA